MIYMNISKTLYLRDLGCDIYVLNTVIECSR